MTEVQARAFRPTLEGRDVLAKSLTGSGKTLSFLVPLAQRLLAEGFGSQGARGSGSPGGGGGGGGISVLVLSPVRELALQIAEAGRQLVRGIGLVVHTVIGGGGNNGVRELRDARKPIHILVATPLTLLETARKNPAVK
jgi:superfamily II DNA/RNA helicase